MRDHPFSTLNANYLVFLICLSPSDLWELSRAFLFSFIFGVYLINSDSHGDVSDEHADGAEDVASGTGEPDVDFGQTTDADAERAHVDLKMNF